MSGYLVHHLLDSETADLQKIAIVDGARSLTYGALADAVVALSARLVKSGIGRGDRVAILLAKSLEECIAIFAVSKANAVFVPINPSLKAAQVRHIINDCGAKALITSNELKAEISEALNDLECLKAILTPGDDTAGAAPPAETAIGEDLAAILYTSGSTGLPKGVMLSHRNLIAGTRIVRTYLEITGEDRILSVLPFSFDYGLNQLLTSVEQGATIVLLTFQLGDEIVKALDTHKITGLAGVPMIWAILTRASPRLARTPLPHLRYITNSGGAVPSPTVKRLHDMLPQTRVFLMYGLTEAFRSTFLPPEEAHRRPTSIGKAIPECEVFPVTTDGRRAKPGEPGILVHRGPTVSLGYWNRPDDTARVLRPNPFRAANVGGDVVCYSGDLVVEDEEGFLYFVARDDAMIKSAGFRISPTEVEEALMASGNFKHVAVIGIPDAWIGQKVHAVAVPGSSSIDTGEVLKAVAVSLPPHMMPARIELVETLPTTPNGKVDYKRLVAERSA